MKVRLPRRALVEHSLHAPTEGEVSRRRRFRAGVLVLFAVLGIGSLGYMLLGLPPFDAVYQTAITITTVGYGEVGPSTEVDLAYRSWTLFLVLVGTGSALYTVGVLFELLVEDRLDPSRQYRRVLKQIEDYEDHVIVAGWGRVGHAIADYARRHGRLVVVIDNDPDVVDESKLPVLIADATSDDVLRAAGVERAHTLVAALDSDAKNLFVTLSARSLAPELFLVVRTNHQEDEPKFYRAGADRVVNPHEIGGSRMAALALQPHVAEFLDEILHDESHDASLLEYKVADDAPAAGQTITQLGAASQRRALVVAVRTAVGQYRANPPRSHVLEPGDVVIAVGTRDELTELGRVLGDASAAKDLRA